MLIQKVKYPRTFHVPWSLGVGSDDKVFTEEEFDASFDGESILITEKLDGECTTIYHDGTVHARSLDSPSHETRSWVKHQATNLIGKIPEGWRVCGENVYAKHSIHYTALTSYFYVYAIYDEKNTCLDFTSTLRLTTDWGLKVVPFKAFIPKFNRKIFLRDLHEDMMNGPGSFSDEKEGYVLRVTKAFPFEDHSICVAKCVRKDHVQSDEHWLKNWIKNIKV